MPRVRRTGSIPIAAFASLLGLISGCHNPVDNGDPRTCQQTYEFGNTGCFEVAGKVVDTRGQALDAIAVAVRPLSAPGATFTWASLRTDSTGIFRLRGWRRVGAPPASASPDTVSVYVLASDPRSAGINVPATIADSVLTVVTVAPVGSIPTAPEVRITLSVP